MQEKLNMNKAKKLIELFNSNEFLDFGDFKSGDRVYHDTYGHGIVNIANHKEKGIHLVDWDNPKIGRSRVDKSKLKKSNEPLPKDYDPHVPLRTRMAQAK
jgi:hypothetical protein